MTKIQYFLKQAFYSHRRFVLMGTLIGLAWIGLLQSAAAELPREPYLPLVIAQKAANAALKKCLGDGYQVSVAVVDRDGIPIVQIRSDHAGPHTVSSSFRKAYTAASLGRSTQDLANMIKDKPELYGLRNMNSQILILAGGLPIKIDNESVGGIGVGGAPGGNLDDACARAGLESLKEEK
ncbi:MAG: GlcG/HbpS family heme-binding protein [Nitrospiria bacterium]